jgi:CRP-like cAMP-binding protein
MRKKSTTNAEVLGFLRSLPLFTRLDKAALQTLAAGSRFVVLDKGEILFFQSDPCDSAYVVRSGRISMVLHSLDGREMVIEEMRAGEIFGEVGMLTRKGRSAGAMAHANSELLAIAREAFMRTLDQDHQFVRSMLEISAQRLQNSAARELALAFMDAQARLARHLLELERNEHDKGYVTASQEDLARGTGLIRQTVAKALGRWRRDGWLLTGRGRILILNRKALEAVESGPLNLAAMSPK